MFSLTPLKDGALHAKNMRDVGRLVGGLLALRERYGDPKAALKMRELARIVFDPTRLATGYGPDADRERVIRVGGKGVTLASLEQPGLKRVNYQKQDSGTPSTGTRPPSYIDTDLHDLDWTLQFGQVSELAYALKQDSAPEYQLVESYARDLDKRLRFLSTQFYPGLPWWAYIKDLRHAVTSRAAWHWFRYLTHDDPSELEAYTALADMLLADTDLVELPGGVVGVAPHFVGPLRMLFKRAPLLAFQDSTYLQESIPHELAMRWTGAPHYDHGYIAAWANTVHMLVLNRGAEDGRMSSSVGGNGPAGDDRQNVISYKGKTYPCRPLQTRATKTENVLQVSRGLSTLTSAWAGKSEYAQTLRDLNKRPDSLEHDRIGSWVGLNYFLGERL